MTLRDKIRIRGERLPKKHGCWYRLHAYDNHWLIYDTWNGALYHYPNGALPSDTNNLYGVVYVFYDKEGVTHNYKSVPKRMEGFWRGHTG